MQCQCEASGFCDRLQAKTTDSSWRLCKAGKLDEMLAGKKQKQRPQSDVGTRLIAAIEKHLGRTITCGACRIAAAGLDQRDSHSFADTMIMMNGHIGGARELGPRPQITLANIIESVIPRQDKPLSGPAVLHFGAHLWPTHGTWQWHVNIWNQVARIVDGQCFVGIAVDGNTERFETVRAALDPQIICREFANNPEGENQTFRWLQEVCPQGLNDVLVYCHGKGAQTHTSQSEAVRKWSEAMYQTVILNHDMIRQRIAQGYSIVGSFREFGRTILMPRHKWHFSGTFFAVRACELADKRVAAKYGGVEAWPGDHFRQWQAWCEFFDDSSHMKLYNGQAWQSEIEPALIEWNRKQRYERDV